MKKFLMLIFIVTILMFSVSAEAALIDLTSIGAIATANASYGSNIPSSAIDGDDSTHWSGTDWTNNWLKVDLGALYDLDQVTLKIHDNANYGSSYGFGYNLLYSTDNSSWTSAGTGGLYDDPITYVDTVLFSGQTVQYLQMYVASGSHWTHLHEMEVYGAAHTSSPSNPVPEPATMLLLGSGLVGLFASKKRKA